MTEREGFFNLRILAQSHLCVALWSGAPVNPPMCPYAGVGGPKYAVEKVRGEVRRLMSKAEKIAEHVVSLNAEVKRLRGEQNTFYAEIDKLGAQVVRLTNRNESLVNENVLLVADKARLDWMEGCKGDWGGWFVEYNDHGELGVNQTSLHSYPTLREAIDAAMAEATS